jgi:cell division protein FtsZ
MHGVQSITDLMVRPGLINLDFADVESVMASMGTAMMGTGEAEGEGRALKAAEMAISNPLIDDYTLKGAKGLLINITGGEDLKLFEVDEVVNKIRSEVDVEAEVIIGAIQDPSLDGKIRVSIVATALDGQQPESKSVINMVHRIQNRNPGYSDFVNNDSAQSFNFPSTTAPISHGANALKLENEAIVEPEANNKSSQIMNEQMISNQEIESIVENNQLSDYEQSFAEEALNNLNNSEETNSLEIEQTTSNGLENFGVEEESSPDLFNSDNESAESKDLLSTETNEDSSGDDDLEIPAFLRRQKH